ncbi:MAG: bifunctional 4-hydroxy-2-oxoglutarate aldolase/2-dehydro-3-deoxy-phosphogluconate aldolase [Alphaproteobacteria bacterium]|nr:bifunctional 4-hydroxy-2-oxoglutarate aldolase/2-dehydro-3-deoxy-phosphogluconate aldolase [Alphaproteobacteria bacterium]
MPLKNTNLSPADNSKQMRDLCAKAPVIPVLTIDDITTAKPLAEALIAGGLPILEVTLRTPCALDAISIMRDVKGGYVGAGTLINADHVRSVKDAGAVFGVSPGASDELLAQAAQSGLPFLAGAATITEMMRLFNLGYDMLKFFPAESSGGMASLKSVAAVLPDISFCPTGGINIINASNYLSLANVTCIGGSWVAPNDLIQNRQWDKITQLAQQASQLGK